MVSFKWRLRSGDRKGGGDFHRETEGSVFGQFRSTGLCPENFFYRLGCVQRRDVEKASREVALAALQK